MADIDGKKKDKFQPRNWHQLKPNETKSLHPVQLSKYLAYSDVPKQVHESQQAVKKRLIDRKKAINKNVDFKTEEELIDELKHEKLIGQLKAAESRTRLRIMRLKYEANRTEEVNHLIACQSTALKAVRLQALVPPKITKQDDCDTLDKFERVRVEKLLEDSVGLVTNRNH